MSFGWSRASIRAGRLRLGRCRWCSPVGSMDGDLLEKNRFGCAGCLALYYLLIVCLQIRCQVVKL